MAGASETAKNTVGASGGRAGAPDEELVDWVAEGDAAAFDELTARWAPILHRWFCGIVKDEFAAANLTQVTLLKVRNGRNSPRGKAVFSSDGWREGEGFGAWIGRVASNAAKDYFRARATILKHEGVSLDSEPSDAVLAAQSTGLSAFDRVLSKQVRESIRACIGALRSDEDRRLCRLLFWEGLTSEAAGSVLWPLSGYWAIQQRIGRRKKWILAQLGKCLKRKGVDCVFDLPEADEDGEGVSL